MLERRIGLGEDERELGVVAQRDPHLRAVELPRAVVLLDGARLLVGGVRAGVGLGEAEAAQPLARAQLGQVALLLLLGAPLEDRRADERGLHRDHRAHGRAAAPDLLADDRVGQVVQARAAVLARHDRAQVALVGDLAHEVEVEVVVARVLPRPGDDLLVGELARGLLDERLLVGEVEVHRRQATVDPCAAACESARHGRQHRCAPRGHDPARTQGLRPGGARRRPRRAPRRGGRHRRRRGHRRRRLLLHPRRRDERHRRRRGGRDAEAAASTSASWPCSIPRARARPPSPRRPTWCWRRCPRGSSAPSSSPSPRWRGRCCSAWPGACARRRTRPGPERGRRRRGSLRRDHAGRGRAAARRAAPARALLSRARAPSSSTGARRARPSSRSRTRSTTSTRCARRSIAAGAPAARPS